MKTRLLALVLACMMVLSVMPVAVFAEDSVCKYAWSDGDHTLKSVGEAGGEAKYIKTVDPQCGKEGYNLYQCPGCDGFFADKFVKPDNNKHNPVLIAKGKPATCKETGLTPKYECSNVTVADDGTEIKCIWTKGGEILPLAGHTISEKIEGNCEANMVVTKTCSVCGWTEKTPTDGQHKWSSAPTAIVSEPYLNANGELVNGEAEYTCTLCETVKKVVIIADHTCELKEIARKEATCVAAGNIQYWQCKEPNCSKIYADAAATTELTAEATVIPAGTNGGHKLTYNAAQKGSCDPATRVVIKNGTLEHWSCSICENNYADEAATKLLTSIVTDGHDWAGEPVTVFPTCETWGFDFYGCLNCGERKEVRPETDDYAPLEHDKYDPAIHTDAVLTTIPCTATTPGKVVATWTCRHVDKNVIDETTGEYKVCGEKRTGDVPGTVHEWSAPVTRPATCTNYEYTFTYCKTCTTGLSSSVSYKDRAYDVTVDGAAVKIVTITYGTTLNRNEHNWKTLSTNPADCDKNGDIREYCPDCDNVFRTLEVKAFHSEPQGAPVADVKATCTTNAYKTYICTKKCGLEYKIVEAGTATGHSAEYEFVETVKPTCSTQGYNVYRCTNVDPNTEERCTHTYKADYTAVIPYVLGTFYAQAETDTAFATMDQYKDTFVGYYGDAHPNAVWVQDDIVGNCVKLGLSMYHCPDCGKNLAVAISGTGLGHRNDGKFDLPGEAEGKAPTCTEDGATDAYFCANGGCGTFIPATVLPKTNHKDASGNSLLVKVTDLPANVCEGGHGYWRCSVADCGKLYTDNKGVNLVDDYFEHAPTLIDGRKENCTEYGYQHFACDNCKLEYIELYRDALGHSWKTTVRQEPTCVTPGKAAESVCTVCGTKDTTNNGATLPATGIHKNSDGKTFTDKCTDTETNRTCTVCKAYIARDHHYAAPVTVDPTCQEVGYILEVCVDCPADRIQMINDGKLGEHNYDGVAWEPVPGNPNMETRMCKTPGCRYVDSRILYEVEYFVDVKNVVDDTVGYHVGYTDSSLIAVSVQVKADVPLWSVRFDVNYDENLTFVDAEAASEILDCTNWENHATEEKRAVTIYAAASNDTDKEPTDVTIEGKEEVFVLYFRVTLPLDEKGVLPAVGFNTTESTISITSLDAINVANENLDANIDSETIEILPFLDVNKDHFVNNSDALFMHEILMGIIDEEMDDNNYQVALDIDQNGVIEAIDYLNLRRYLVGSLSYQEMTEIGVPAEELA